MFTQRHYIKIASTLKQAYRYTNSHFDAVGKHIADRIITDLIEMLKNNNEKFSESKFISAIYGKEKKDGN